MKIKIPYVILVRIPKLYISYLKHRGMQIGEGTRFFGFIFIDETRPDLVKIGKNCWLLDGVNIYTHGAEWHVLYIKYGDLLETSAKVTIGNNVVIGLNTLILKGVTIGDNVIIGSNSTVTRSIPSDSVAWGSPCRVQASLAEYCEKRKVEALNEQRMHARSLDKRRGRNL